MFTLHVHSPQQVKMTRKKYDNTSSDPFETVCIEFVDSKGQHAQIVFFNHGAEPLEIQGTV